MRVAAPLNALGDTTFRSLRRHRDYRLYYAGNGLFCYSHDMLNMTHVGETIGAMGWRPPATFNMPPRQPNRDVALPKAWAHLEKSRAR